METRLVFEGFCGGMDAVPVPGVFEEDDVPVEVCLGGNVGLLFGLFRNWGCGVIWIQCGRWLLVHR